MKQTASVRIIRVKRTCFEVVALLLIGLTSLFAQSVRVEESSETHSGKTGFVDAVARACPAVVSIQGEKQYDASELRGPLPGRSDAQRENVTHIGMGTGIIVDERGYIVTNYHVVKGLMKIQITTSDGTTYRDVEFIRNDLKTDLALIKITPASELTRIHFGHSCDVDLAEDVVAIGNPYGYQVSVTKGIVSGLNRPLKASETLSYENVIQTDTAINPGNSGGPLVNIKGEMIGLNAAVREGAENIAFAIPVDIVVEVTDRMIRQSVAKMTHHGLTLKAKKTSADQTVAITQNPQGRSSEEQVVVEAVAPNSPAASAGIQKGDVLVMANKKKISTPLDFTRSLIDVKLMDSIELSVMRQGNPVTANLSFSGSSMSGEEQLIATRVQANRPIASQTDSVQKEKFETAQTASSYGLAGISGEDSQEGAVRRIALRKSTSHETLDKPELIRQAFGIEIDPVQQSDFRKNYPHLSVVSMGQSKIYPAGGVIITQIDDNSIFSTQKDKLEKGDLIFGFVVGDNPDNRWGVTSVDDLYYIAQKLDEMSKTTQQSLLVRVYLIRGDTPYFLDMEF
ncbi:MAG: trypsin-like peptidase domain-containing protein [Thermoguttaceae bacterium]|nr:trypsin-like peptidase domain-containing protein [Thermoguttaceae bacterium]